MMEMCEEVTGNGSKTPDLMALFFRNGGSQIPDRWLSVDRNTHDRYQIQKGSDAQCSVQAAGAVLRRLLYEYVEQRHKGAG